MISQALPLMVVHKVGKGNKYGYGNKYHMIETDPKSKRLSLSLTQSDASTGRDPRRPRCGLL